MKQPTAFWGSNARSADNGAALTKSLQRVVDSGLCGVIFVAPYFFGGRHDLGRLVFVSLIAVTATAWFARQALLPASRWPRTAAHGLLLLAAALVALQVIPLPVDWLARISPRTEQLLPLWTPGGNSAVHLGTWQTLSFVPHETTKALAMLLSYSLLFMVVIGRIEDYADAARLLTWIGASAALMAVFGFLQFYTSDGRFFWFYEHAHRSASQCLEGPFINRNHFADFLVLGFGPLLSYLPLANRSSTTSAARHHLQSDMKPPIVAGVLAAAAALVMTTILLSRSRGGAVALLVAGAVFVTICLSRGLVDRRFMYGLAVLAVVVGGMLAIHGADQVIERLDDFTEGSFDNIDQGGIRRKIWAANIAAFEAGWLTGAGVGSHCEICQIYLPQYFTKDYTHAENGYLQIASETGIGGVVLLAAGMGLVAAWCVCAWRYTTDAVGTRLLGATAAGLAASAVHSAVDFVWYIPACMSIVVVLAGCALRLSQFCWPAEKRTANRPVMTRGRWWELAAATILIGGWSVHTYIGPGIAAVYWERYLRASVSHSEIVRPQTAALITNRKDSKTTDQVALNEAMLRELEQVVRWDPQFARAHLKLAVRCIAQFDLDQQRAKNAMTLPSICDTIGNSRFPSRTALRAWLERAVGRNLRWLERAAVEARTAVELCPLQGEAYMHLAQLSILDGADSQAVHAYSVQALRVRPHNADVFFEIGREELAENHLEAALKRWQLCFDDPGPHQAKIVSVLAGRIPAAQFVSTFHPDWPLLRNIWSRYRESGASEDLATLLTYSAEKTRSATISKGGIPPAFIWYWQSQLYAEVGHTSEALACLLHAYQCDPRQYSIRCAGQSSTRLGPRRGSRTPLSLVLSAAPVGQEPERGTLSYLEDAVRTTRSDDFRISQIAN